MMRHPINRLVLSSNHNLCHERIRIKEQTGEMNLGNIINR